MHASKLTGETQHLQRTLLDWDLVLRRLIRNRLQTSRKSTSIRHLTLATLYSMFKCFTAGKSSWVLQISSSTSSIWQRMTVHPQSRSCARLRRSCINNTPVEKRLTKCLLVGVQERHHRFLSASPGREPHQLANTLRTLHRQLARRPRHSITQALQPAVSRTCRELYLRTYQTS